MFGLILDLFAAISDGVFDVTNPAAESFGEERVREILVRHADEGPDGVLSALQRSWSGSQPGQPPATTAPCC